jgi:hypothetical protein
MNEQPIQLQVPIPESAPTMTKVKADKILSSINMDKILVDMKPKIDEAREQALANERAEREPLPSVVEAALDINPNIIQTSVGGVEIRKMVMSDITIFKLTGSPFYKLMMGDIKVDDNTDPMKVLFSDEEVVNAMVYQFTHPVRDVYKAARADLKAYQEKVTEEVGFVYSTTDVLELAGGIFKMIGMVNNAKVELQSPPDSTDKKKLTT